VSLPPEPARTIVVDEHALRCVLGLKPDDTVPDLAAALSATAAALEIMSAEDARWHNLG
jgi:hypothetical protein